MNERIKELALQAMTDTTNKFSADREWSADEWRDFYDTKFAELIVQECVDTIKSNRWAKDNQSWSKGMQYSAELIKEHFGVEQ